MTLRSMALSLLSILVLVFAACSDDADSPTGPTRVVVPQAVTDEIAQTSAAATAWILNDLAQLATYWADGDLRTAPPRLQRPNSTAVYDEESGRWVLALESTLVLEGESYEIGGTARIGFLAAGAPVRDASAADAMDVVAEFSVFPRLRAKGVERDLELTVTLRMGAADLATRPLSLEGSGHSVGVHRMVDASLERQASIDLDWSFVLGRASQNCCPEGTLDLTIEEGVLTASFDGSPLPVQSGSFDGVPVDGFFVEDFALPCVQVGVARGSVLRSGGRLMAGAKLDTPLMKVEIAGRPLQPGRQPTAGTLRFEGMLGGEPLDFPPVSIHPAMTLGAALDSVRARAEERLRWQLGLRTDADGALVLDNSAQVHLPPETRALWLSGILPMDAYATGSHMLQTMSLLAVADPEAELRFLHKGNGGTDMNLGTGDIVALQGSVNGMAISNTWFTIGSPPDRDGSTLQELLAWLEVGLSTAAGGPVPCRLDPDGFVVLDNQSGSDLDDIRLSVGGRVNFNQAMVFGNTIRTGESMTNSARLLRPTRLNDALSDLYNGNGDRLEFDFDPFTSRTTISLTGHMGGEAIIPHDLVVEDGMTTVDELLAATRAGFRIFDPSGVKLTEDGRIDVRSNLGEEFGIDTISWVEEGNPFSNLGISMDFGVVSAAKDARPVTRTAFVYDPRGDAHELELYFEQPTPELMWVLSMRAIGEWEVVRGSGGEIHFGSDLRVREYLSHDGEQLVCRVPVDAASDLEFVVDLLLDGPTGLAMFGPTPDLAIVANGQPYITAAAATDLRVVVECSDGTDQWTSIDLSVSELPGGSVVTTQGRLLSPARPEASLQSLRSANGGRLFGVVGPSIGLQGNATLDEVERSFVELVDLDSTNLEDFLVSSFERLDFPIETFYLDGAGHLQVYGALGGPTVQRLGFVEHGAPNPLLESSLDFEVTQQAFAGCR